MVAQSLVNYSFCVIIYQFRGFNFVLLQVVLADASKDVRIYFSTTNNQLNAIFSLFFKKFFANFNLQEMKC